MSLHQGHSGHPRPGWNTGPGRTNKPAPVAWAMGEARATSPSAYENAAAMVRTLNEIRALPEKESA